MANFRLSQNARNLLLEKLRDVIDAGSGAGTMSIYSGTQPATADTALSGNTLLATLTFADPSAGSASGGSLAFSHIVQDVSADNPGTATWARIRDSAGVTVFDCDVATAGATLTIDSATVVASAPISFTDFLTLSISAT